jgi:hypothetical protein
MKNTKLFVATPMFGGQCFGAYAVSLLNLAYKCMETGTPLWLQTKYNESLVTRGRNDLVTDFLATDFTHLMFIDADIEFNAEDVLKMIDKDVDIIAGVYPKKLINWENVSNAVKSGVPPQDLHLFSSFQNVNTIDTKSAVIEDMNEAFEVRHAATGFMLIKREVFEKLADHMPKALSDNVNEQARRYTVFFDTSIRDGTYLSEDWHFCDAWRDIGGKIHIAPWVKLQHHGTHNFSGGLHVA